MAKEVLRISAELEKIEVKNIEELIRIYESVPNVEDTETIIATLKIAKECVVRCAKIDRRRKANE